MNILIYVLLMAYGHTPTTLSPSGRPTVCKSERDILTQRTIFTSAEMEPECEGGKSALIRKLNKISISKGAGNQDYDGNFLVAFIVDVDGSITGERVIKGSPKEVGLRILALVKSLKWTAAYKCGKY